MTYIIVPTKPFTKAARKLRKGGKKHLLALLAEVIDLLAIHDNRSLFMLSTRWRDHELKGNKKGIRELHLNQDDLLLYDIDEAQQIIKLLDIVNHEELRKQ